MDPKIISDNIEFKYMPINNIDEFKHFLYKYAEYAPKIKVDHKPTYQSRTNINGEEFYPDDIWYDTNKKEYWVLMYKTKDRMHWWRFSKLVERVAETMYIQFREWRIMEKSLNKTAKETNNGSNA